jgi:hypothetical protein
MVKARLSLKDSVSIGGYRDKLSADHHGAGAAGIRVVAARLASANTAVIGPARVLQLGVLALFRVG